MWHISIIKLVRVPIKVLTVLVRAFHFNKAPLHFTLYELNDRLSQFNGYMQAICRRVKTNFVVVIIYIVYFDQRMGAMQAILN